MSASFHGTVRAVYKTDGNKKRLRKAARILNNLRLPRGAVFKMNTWGRHRGAHDPDERNYCGTAACGWGWVSLDKSVQRDGVRAYWSNTFGRSGRIIGHYLSIEYQGYSANDAAAQYFSITDREADWLFMPAEYKGRVTPKRVARRIEMLLAGIEVRTEITDSSEPGYDDIQRLALTRNR